jgi:membrane associated rhomboid family serine protease
MIPYSDSTRAHRTPIVNVAVIAICSVVFIAELLMSEQDLNRFIFDWGVRPVLVTDALEDPAGADAEVWFSLLTSMFLHGGLLHLAGNMVFLWVFGDNIEDQFGHVAYVVFYLVCGLIATATQIVVDPESPIPTIGASGAISGVLGGYLVFFPSARVKIIIPIYFIPFRAAVSAGFLLLAWIALQIFSGAVSIMDVESGEGIAWFAHIGGFVAGLVLCGLWRAGFGIRGTRG